MSEFQYPDPIQGDPEVRVTRQTGLPVPATAGFDPQPPPAIVQGDSEVTATRNVGNGASRFGPDGTLYADHVAEDGTLYADIPVIAVGQPAQPPRPAPASAGAPPVVPPLVGVMQADQPGERGGDPRDPGSAPQVFSAEQLAAAKKKAGR